MWIPFSIHPLLLLQSGIPAVGFKWYLLLKACQMCWLKKKRNLSSCWCTEFLLSRWSASHHTDNFKLRKNFVLNSRTANISSSKANEHQKKLVFSVTYIISLKQPGTEQPVSPISCLWYHMFLLGIPAKLQEALFSLGRETRGVRASPIPRFPSWWTEEDNPALRGVWGLSVHTALRFGGLKSFQMCQTDKNVSGGSKRWRTGFRLQNKLAKFSVVQMQLILCRTITKIFLQRLFPTSALFKSHS